MFEKIAKDITDRLNFIEACGINAENSSAIKQVDFFTSHEALLLNYEEALTRKSSLDDKWYDCSAHMIWIGERTRKLDEAHLEFFKGIQNPIGVKVSDKITDDEFLRLIDALNPDNEAGRLTLITRMGADKLKDNLPRLVQAVQKEGKKVLWTTDPMHGNTFTTNDNIKSRDFSTIMSEIKSFFDIHHAEGTIPAGIHVELTGMNVTECVGGMEGLDHDALKRNYQTSCDPRLNAVQSIELAFKIAEMIE